MVHRRFRALQLALLVMPAVACHDPETAEPFNFVLFVLDTTRFDAVAPDGPYPGTTPAFDALAREGLRYTRAFAQSSWTLPSHVSMFTGLLPSQHGAGWREIRARDDLVMLAEVLRDAGYETFGVSENPWVSETFNLDQGFDRLAFAGGAEGAPVVETVSRWLADRKPKPFFLFVNVLDAHAPYTVRVEALPREVSLSRARRIPQDPAVYICAHKDTSRPMQVLRALYQGEVTAADAKLGAVMRALDRNRGGHTVTIAVSDHGELFGENNLASHVFSVHGGLVHVPLVVHGLPGVAPAVIDAPVALVDVMPSILGWAGLERAVGGPGRPLPVDRSAGGPTRDIVVEYADPARLPLESDLARAMLGRMDVIRAQCSENSRVFGMLRAVIRYPFKLVEYERHAPELFDLARDPAEVDDLVSEQAARVSELASALGPRPDAAPAAPSLEPVDDEILDALESLGYVDDPDESASPE